MPVVAFATCRDKPDLTGDDALVAPLLPAGIEIVPIPWDDPGVDWRGFDAVVPRSTWDYHLRRGEFELWLDRLDAGGVELKNSTAAARWNLEKTYLRDLAAVGVETVPTVWLAAGERVDLESLVEERGWNRIVVKPTVGASGWGLFVADQGSAGRSQRALDTLLGRGGAMIQPLLDEVARDGEWSLIFLGGEFSHAAVKRARDGEVRVQSDFGGTVQRATPRPALREWAERCVARCARHLGPAGESEPLLYARVDAVSTTAGPLLMELELIEPQLFLGLARGAAGRFANALVARLRYS